VVQDGNVVQSLERTRRWKVLLRDHSFRWIDVKEFKTQGLEGLTPREVLAAVLEHPSYRDHYASPDSETDAPIHGPYRMDTISVDDFEPFTAAEALAELKTWLEMYGGVPSDQIDGDLAGVVRLIENGDSRFRLRDLGKQAQRDWGWVVGMQGFHEFVVIGPGDYVRVIVGSDD
jgi:hypothetical protein